MYIYKAHIGSFFVSDKLLKSEELYCTGCGDSDEYLGEANTWQEALTAINIDSIQCYSEGGWTSDYIYEFLKSSFEDVPEYEDFLKYMREIKIHNTIQKLFKINGKEERKYLNSILLSEYPFLEDDYDNFIEEIAMSALNIYTWFDEIPIGWAKAFGEDLLKDLKEALIEDGCLKEFSFAQIKEKFGELRIYADNYGEKTQKVIRKYEDMSGHICVNCGKEAKYISTDWICPWCEDCIDKSRGSYKEI